MSKPPQVTPPFAWLGRYWVPVSLALVTGTGAWFRFYQLTTLPPGLDETSARVGVQALGLSSSHFIPSLNAANSFSPLWVWLQAIAAPLSGHSMLGLRLWSALLGTLAVVAMWLWLRDWFGARIAWIGAFTLAVSPWAITVSRSGLPGALPVLLVPLTLWLCGRVRQHPSSKATAALGGVLALDLLSGPIGCLLAATILVFVIIRLTDFRPHLAFNRARIIGLSLFTAGLAGLTYFLATSLDALKTSPQTLNLLTSPATFFTNLVKVLLMFNVHGDENYRHNLAGEPLLNAFVGLMLVTGLLVGISRLHQRRYRALLVLAVVLLLPAAFTGTGAPNSSWAVGALPLVFALVGIGASWMLELWYATFPINSAARASGQAAIILLLALTLLQGYTQYFRAWAGSTAVYVAYNEGVTQIADHVRSDKFTGERFVVVPSEQMPVIQYLDHGLAGYRLLAASDLAGLPIAGANRQFYIATASRDEAVKILKAKFPGGILRPHYSSFNQVEIYYTYEVAK